MDTTINGANIHYIAQGDPQGLPLVFLHGFPFSHAMWIPQLRALDKSFYTIAYDLRGHGQSSVGDGQYTLEGHVDDLLCLLDQLKIDKAVVVGLSMGGYIALRALERNPERFRAAVLCDTRSEADSDEAKLRRAAQVKQVKQKGSADFAEGFLKAVFAQVSFEERPQAVTEIRRIISQTQPLSIAGTLLALAARSDTTRSLPKLRIPTLILVGELDTITPAEAARAMHEKIAGSKLAVIPRSGHLSNFENPEDFNRHFLEFLQGIPT
jgi:3-oxoadipate enol-lactonase